MAFVMSQCGRPRRLHLSITTSTALKLTSVEAHACRLVACENGFLVALAYMNVRGSAANGLSNASSPTP